MKYLSILFFLGLFSLLLPRQAFGQKEIFLKQIEFELTQVSDVDYENEYFLTLKLTKGTKYVFAITNEINDKPGEAVLELLDADNLVLTNVLGEKYYPTINFMCNKTGFYDVLVRFRENRLGHCQVDVTMIQ